MGRTEYCAFQQIVDYMQLTMLRDKHVKRTPLGHGRRIGSTKGGETPTLVLGRVTCGDLDVPIARGGRHERVQHQQAGLDTSLFGLPHTQNSDWKSSPWWALGGSIDELLCKA